MSGEGARVAARMEAVRQLSAAVSAMQGVAAARMREAEARLSGVRAHAATVAQAMGEALALLPYPGRRPAAEGRPGRVVFAICAEQGFVGGFDERVLEAVQAEAPDELMLVGARAEGVARSLGLPVGWTAAMAAHVDQAAPLADRATEALLAAGAGRVTLVHAMPGAGRVRVVRRALVPFDYGRFPAPPPGRRPQITLPPEVLVVRLAEEYLFAELCEALVLSFAAENEARLRVMVSASAAAKRQVGTLSALARRLRQQEITDEIVELAAGAAPARR